MKCNGSKNTTNRKKYLKYEVSVKDMKQFKILLDIFTEMILDERIDKNIRRYYQKTLIENIETGD